MAMVEGEMAVVMAEVVMVGAKAEVEKAVGGMVVVRAGAMAEVVMVGERAVVMVEGEMEVAAMVEAMVEAVRAEG